MLPGRACARAPIHKSGGGARDEAYLGGRVSGRSTMPINPTDLSQPGAPHVDSYWAATAGAEVEGADPIAGDIEVDVAVIGGGYTGLSAASHLGPDHGIAPPVLEAPRLRRGSTGPNAP